MRGCVDAGVRRHVRGSSDDIREVCQRVCAR